MGGRVRQLSALLPLTVIYEVDIQLGRVGYMYVPGAGESEGAGGDCPGAAAAEGGGVGGVHGQHPQGTAAATTQRGRRTRKGCG
jgi:hypothetical protein